MTRGSGRATLTLVVGHLSRPPAWVRWLAPGATFVASFVLAATLALRSLSPPDAGPSTGDPQALTAGERFSASGIDVLAGWRLGQSQAGFAEVTGLLARNTGDERPVFLTFEVSRSGRQRTVVDCAGGVVPTGRTVSVRFCSSVRGLPADWDRITVRVH